MQAAFLRALGRKQRSMKVPMMGSLCIGNREVAWMLVGACRVGLVGKWTFSCSAWFWVHRRGATQGQDGKEWVWGPCDNIQRGATCAGEVKGHLRGWGEC